MEFNEMVRWAERKFDVKILLSDEGLEHNVAAYFTKENVIRLGEEGRTIRILAHELGHYLGFKGTPRPMNKLDYASEDVIADTVARQFLLYINKWTQQCENEHELILNHYTPMLDFFKVPIEPAMQQVLTRTAELINAL